MVNPFGQPDHITTILLRLPLEEVKKSQNMFYTLFRPFNVDIMMKSGSVVGSGGCRVPILGELGGSGASFFRKPKPRYFFEGFPNREASKNYLAYF